MDCPLRIEHGIAVVKSAFILTVHPPFVPSPFVVMLQTDLKREGRGVRGESVWSSAFSARSALKTFPGSGLHYCASMVCPLCLETPDRLARHSPASIRLVDPKRSRVDCHPNHGSREDAKTNQAAATPPDFARSEGSAVSNRRRALGQDAHASLPTSTRRAGQTALVWAWAQTTNPLGRKIWGRKILAAGG
jgi:hypothetical protein